MATQLSRTFKRFRFVLIGALLIAGIGYSISRPSFGLQALNGGIRFTLEEANNQFILHLWTQANSYSSSDVLRAARIRHSDQQIEIAIYGIKVPGGARPADTIPLHWETLLGAISGTLDVTLIYGGQRDHYTLTITPDRVQLQGSSIQFTTPDQQIWQRLPSDTLWVAISMYRNGEYLLPTDAEIISYRQEVTRVIGQIEAQGCVPFVPDRGFYTHRDFVAPWPEVWRPKEGFVEIPGGPTRAIGAASIQPTVTFWHCGVHAVAVHAIVADYINSAIAIALYDWSSEPTISRIS